ncbi:MAG: hypothetical protein GWP91_06200 [Rhodobacterales bacterium]|nr:hypothetical protein [Rhodobacterales bacterium]
MKNAPLILGSHEDMIAVNKPAGMPVHPTGLGGRDLTTWLKKHTNKNMAPAHRLDQGTSGIVLCSAKTKVRAKISAWLEAGEVDKTYVALVFGKTREKGTIRRPLRDARRKKDLDAETRYRTVESFEKWSLLEVYPATGRKHQIRRHLQGLGHAVVGDDRYRQRGKPTVPGFPGRLWLHAGRVVLPDGEVFEAPIPAELKAHLALLRESITVEE